MSATPVAELDPALAAPAADKPIATGPCCAKCQSPLGGNGASICKRCGWYAVAGVFVDVDGLMEKEPEEEQPARDDRLPWWAWVAFASVVAVIIESAVVRKYTPDSSGLRTAWSGIQFLLGVVAFLGAQIVGFVILMQRDTTASILDVILKPFKVSALLFRDLPRRFWIVNAGISGVASAFAAVVVIGSVPYHVLWSWNVDYRSSQHLEDALKKETSPISLPEEAKEDRNRKTITCVIIGYELTEAGNIRVVLVAREVNGKLQYTGGVTPSGDSALLFELRENLMAIPSSGPVLPMTFNSNWVLPKYMCQVSYGTEQDNKKLTDLRWEGDVRALRMPGE